MFFFIRLRCLPCLIYVKPIESINMIQQDFMASEESWISAFGCKGVLLMLEPEKDELVITTTGAKINSEPVEIDIYTTIGRQPMIGIKVRPKTNDVGDLIEAEKKMIKAANGVVNARLNRDLTEEEEGFLHDCLFSIKKEEE